MKDDFMYSLRQEPEQTFSASLKKRLEESDRQSAVMLASGKARLRFGFSLAMLGLILAILFSVSSVRAKLRDLVIKIGEQGVIVSQEYPKADQTALLKPIAVPISQAAENGVFLPAPLPKVFTLADDHYLFYQAEGNEKVRGDWAEVTWIGPNDEKITMTVMEKEVMVLIGSESLKEILLKGTHTAGLYKGGWNTDTQSWDESIPVYSLVFVKEGQSICFTGSNSEDLILMAELLFP